MSEGRREASRTEMSLVWAGRGPGSQGLRGEWAESQAWEGRGAAREKLHTGWRVRWGLTRVLGRGWRSLTWTLVLLLPIVEVTEEEELLSRKMMKYWANFARNG